MTSTYVALAILAVGTLALKAAGPLAAADRELPPRLARLVELLPAAMLAGLVATGAVTDGPAIVADARLVGVAAAAVALGLRAPFAVVVLVGAAATALTRASGWG